MEFVPLFFVAGLLFGGLRVIGLVLAVVALVSFWTYLWVSTGGDLYDDGVIGPPFWLGVIVANAVFALLGVAAHRGLRRVLGR